MKVLKRKIPKVSYFYLKEMDTQLFLSPSILSVHWTLVIRSEFFVQPSFSISVLALPNWAELSTLLHEIFATCLFRDFDVRLFVTLKFRDFAKILYFESV